MFTETYNFVTDFTSLVGPLPYVVDLEREIRASGNAPMVAKFEYTELIPGGAPTDCLVTLNAALTISEKSALTAVITAHVGFVTNPTPPTGPGEPGGVAQLDPSGVVPASQLPPWQEDRFTPTNGQITFILSQAPGDPGTVEFSVNGVLIEETVDYIVSGTTVTFLNTPYTMETTDLVTIRYR